MEREKKSALWVTIPILIAVISCFIIADMASASHWTAQYIAMIDKSRSTAIQLTAAATAASAAITFLPGDVATPIASELASLPKTFMAVLVALYLEKFILTLSNVIVFKFLVPAGCCLFAAGNAFRKELFKSLGKKIIIFAAAFLLLIPASLQISAMIEDSYQDSINQVIESAENSSNQIQKSMGTSQADKDESNGLAKVIQSLKNAGDTIASGTSQIVQYFERLLSRFIESAAIMLVVSCVIPVLVILLFGLIIKSLFNVNITPPPQYQALLDRANAIVKNAEPQEIKEFEYEK